MGRKHMRSQASNQMTDGPDLFEMGWLNKPPVVAGVLPDQPQSSPGNLLLSILSVPLDLAFFFSSLFGLILAHWLASGNQTTAASTERPSTSLDQDPAAFSGSGSGESLFLGSSLSLFMIS
jgi:hypothetical protein